MRRRCSPRVVMSSGLEARASDPECRQEMRFRWVWDVDAMTVSIEFLSCRQGETGGNSHEIRGRTLARKPARTEHAARSCSFTAIPPRCGSETKVACVFSNPSEYQAALSRPHRQAFRITEQCFYVFHRPPRIEWQEVFPKKQAHDPFGEICWKIQ